MHYPELFLFFPSMTQQPLVGLGLLIVEASRSHSDTQHSVGLPWTSDPPLRRDLYLTTHNTHKRQTSMPPVGFEPTIPASERPQTHALDRAASEIDPGLFRYCNYFHVLIFMMVIFA
jgi:hypothetical protein